MKSRIITALALAISLSKVVSAQTVGDGCMDITMVVERSYISASEDNEFFVLDGSDEHVWYWYGRDLGDLDGQDWRSSGCITTDGLGIILAGWLDHADRTLFTNSYGVNGSAIPSDVPQFLSLRGRYWGDDCGTGSVCDYNDNSFTCLFSPDERYRDEVYSNSINYRAIGPPNSNNISQYIAGGSSAPGAEIRTRWTSPRPSSILASPQTACSGEVVTLYADGAVQGGDYDWYEVNSGSEVLIGSGQSILVSPTVLTTYRVYTTNGGIRSNCYQEIDVNVVGCSPNCHTEIAQLPSVQSVDGSAQNLIPVTFNTQNSGFANNSLITDVNVTVTWTKTDGSCGSQSSGNAFHAETFMELRGPSTACSNTSLVDGDFSGGADIPTITTTFDESSSNIVAGTPTSTTYNPSGNLDNCIGGSPFGPWSLWIGDNVTTDPLCVSAYQVEVCACDQPTNPTAATASPNRVCSNDPGSITLVATGGSGEEVHWFSGACASSGPIAIALNGDPISIPSPTSTTTYFARWYSGGVCGYSSACMPVTVVVDQPSVPGDIFGSQSVLCQGDDPLPLALIGSVGVVDFWEVSTDGGASYAPLAGTSGSAAYDPPVILSGGLYNYRVQVSNGVCAPQTTLPYSININPQPSYVTIEIQDPVICTGETTALGLISPIGSIQWEMSTDNVNFSPLSNETNSVLLTPVLTNTSASDSTYYFRATLGNAPCNSITTSTKSVTVTANPVAGAISADQTICEGDVPSAVSVSGTLGSIEFWEIDTNASFTNPVAFGSGLSSVSGSSLGALMQTSYVRVITANGVCSNDTSGTLTINVIIPPSNTIAPGDTICTGAIPGILVGDLPSFGTGTYTYLWQAKPMSSSAFTDIPNSDTKDLDMSSYSTNTVFRRVVTSGPCTVVSNEAYLAFNPVPSISVVTSADVDCNGNSSGSISIAAVNAILYSIDDGVTYQNSPNFSGLAAGNYDVVVENIGGCPASYALNPVVIDEPNALSGTSTSTNPSCATSVNGSITVSANGGTGPYQYSLNGNAYQPSTTFNGLVAGNYSIEIIDSRGCTFQLLDTLFDAYGLVVSVDSVGNASCAGQVNGSVQLSVSGGVAPYSFSLDGGVTVQSDSLFTGLNAGVYNILVEDINGCSSTTVVSIGTGSPLVVMIDSVKFPSCFGFSDGEAYPIVMNGTAPYSYNWSDGSSNDTLLGVTSGVYNLIVTDANGCNGNASTTLSHPSPLIVSLNNKVDVDCYNNSTGSADVNVAGGSPTYSYAWDLAGSVIANTEDISNLLSGSYLFTATDANGCQTTLPVLINQPSNPFIINTTATDASCAMSSDGSISVVGSGGTSPYQFALLPNAYQGSGSFAGLDTGTFTVNAIDANGCFTTRDETINPAYALNLALDTAVGISCAGFTDGQLIVTATGGAGPYTYSIDGGITSQSTGVFSGLTPGHYTVTVEDPEACSASVTAFIDDATPVQVVIDSLANPLCYNSTDGKIHITAIGGNAPYTYSWSNGSIAEDQIAIPFGTYTVVARDINGCEASNSATLYNPSELTGYISSIDDVLCFGDSSASIDFSVNGGTGPYLFDWTSNNGYVAFSEDLISIPVGEYYIRVTDAHGCTLDDTAMINGPTSALIGSMSTTDVLCYGDQTGSAQATVGGGTTPYSYQWSSQSTGSSLVNNLGAGVINVLVIDRNGCLLPLSGLVNQPSAPLDASILNSTDVVCFGQADGSIDALVSGGTLPYQISWTNGQNNQSSITGLGPDTYTIYVIDDNNCADSATATINEPDSLAVSISGTSPSCFGSDDGIAVAQVGGGISPYTLTWNHGVSGLIANNLSGDSTYVAIAVDANGCIAQDSIYLIEPDSIQLIFTTEGATCLNGNDGVVTVSAIGGTGPFVYELNGFAQDDSVFTDLGPGVYTVYVEDVFRCTEYGTFTIDPLSTLSIEMYGTNTSGETRTDVITAVRGEQINLGVNLFTPSGVVTSYVWDPAGEGQEGAIDTAACLDAASCSNPFIIATEDDMLSVVVFEDGCPFYDTLELVVNEEALAYIPTAFSPGNADGRCLNEYFEYNIQGCLTSYVIIYDRWGNKVFENEAQENGPSDPDVLDCDNPRNAWDGSYPNGTMAPVGSYAYTIEVNYFDGNSETLKGTITLVR